MNRVVAYAVLLLLGGCGHNYIYVPTTNATADVRGRVAADYAIPPQNPQGDVRLAPFGLTDVSSPSHPNEKFRAIHLRAVIANDGSTQWTFDTSEQRLDLEGHGPIAPAFASANAGSPPPNVTIPPNGKRTVDLFFLLPPNLQHASEIPEFDALWRVNTNPTVVARRTPFERLIIVPDYYDYDEGWDWGWDYGPGYYWGGPYWVNPVFPWGEFPAGYFGPDAVIVRNAHFARHS